MSDDAKRKELGSRGKSTEKVVHDHLESLNKRLAQFDYSRIYDARSAKGKFPSRPGDFEFYRVSESGKCEHGLIEAKELKHDYRLPEKNFPTGGIARLRKRQMAGGLILVVIHHTTVDQWRIVPLKWFFDKLEQPSWDLREFTPYETLTSALRIENWEVLL